MLYIGVTNNLERRVFEHKGKLVPGFTSHYNLNRRFYFEQTNDVGAVITREKEPKGWRRDRKIVLIEPVNPRWSDLSRGWTLARQKANRCA
jgi:putative endonuclease